MSEDKLCVRCKRYGPVRECYAILVIFGVNNPIKIGLCEQCIADIKGMREYEEGQGISQDETQ